MNGDAELEQSLCDGCWALKAAEKRFNELPEKQKGMLMDMIIAWEQDAGDTRKCRKVPATEVHYCHHSGRCTLLNQ